MRRSVKRAAAVVPGGKTGRERTVRLHPQEVLLRQARALQQSEAISEYRQRRVVVEHRLARLVQLGIRQSRYFGRAKTKFQLNLAATRGQPDPGGRQGRSCRPTPAAVPASAAPSVPGPSVPHLGIVPARLCQILTMALLTSGTAEIIAPRTGLSGTDF